MDKRAYAFVDEHQNDIALEMKKLLDVKSVSMTHDGIEECAAFVRDMCREAGIEAEVYPTSGHPVVIGHVDSPVEGAPTLLIYGHYDVMPEGPLELWDTDPYDAVIKDGRIWGRGSSDNKGQFFCHIKAQEIYRKFCGDVPVNLRYIFEGEEEMASPHLPEAVEKYRDLLTADFAICSDAGLHASGRPTLQLGVKGLCSVKLTCRTISKPIHSQYAAAAASANWRLINALATMKGPEGAVLVDGFYDDVVDPDPKELELLKTIPNDPEAQKAEWGTDHLLQNRKTDDYYYNYMYEPTCNVGCISGGYVDGSKNVNVDEAVAFIDCRLVPNQTPAKIADCIEAHLKKRGYGDIKVERTLRLPWSKTGIDCPYFPVVTDAMRAAYGEEPIVFASVGGSAPFYLFNELGADWMMLPIGNADQNEHGPNENMTLDCMSKGIKMGMEIIDRMGKK